MAGGGGATGAGGGVPSAGGADPFAGGGVAGGGVEATALGSLLGSSNPRLWSQTLSGFRFCMFSRRMTGMKRTSLDSVMRLSESRRLLSFSISRPSASNLRISPSRAAVSLIIVCFSASFVAISCLTESM
ncbi:MAG: hypothetical protein EOP10_35040 [Proteobacteria bacterium]|nr:MAG: hypothetical protein EOP10_35040 [Pseudomonadota bacterium]